jgi:hypothetical protein
VKVGPSLLPTGQAKDVEFPKGGVFDGLMSFDLFDVITGYTKGRKIL